MKKGTLVWVLAKVNRHQDTNTDKDTIIVDPQGMLALPYYAPTEFVKQLTQVEICDLQRAEII
jgi:hypothetical protein